MRQAKVNLYSVNELTGKAKDKAIEAGREWHNATFDSAEMTEQLKEYAHEKHGVKADDVNWSISFSQGDGVAFYGTIDLDELAKKHENVKKLVDAAAEIDVTLSVTSEGRNNRYHHWNSMSVTAEHDTGYRYSERFADDDETPLMEKADKLATELQEAVAEILKAASRDTHSWGEKCVLADSEDSAIVELLEENEWEFDVNGKPFGHPEAE
jgi:hydroxyacyl-ACP dehydratase HTD2-like protein with hotdog domain